MVNRIRISVLAGVFIASLCLLARAEEFRPDSQITEVTVYPGAALVTRSAGVQLPAGEHSVVFGDIIPRFNENALSVSGQGKAGVKLFGARMKTDYLKEDPSERVRELQARIEELQDRINHKNTMRLVLDGQKEFLESIKMYAGQQLPKELVTEMPTAQELEDVRLFLADNYEDIETRKERIHLDIREYTREKDVLQRELDALRRTSAKQRTSIVVDLECLRPGPFELDVSYMVYNVNWRPVYDARVAMEDKHLDLSCFGYIRQTSGEDWDNVRLTLSTAKPTVGGKMPELSSWYLMPPPAGEGRMGKSIRMMNSARVNGRFFSAGRERGEEALGIGGSPQTAPAQTVYAQAENKGTAITYSLSKPMTVKTDGEEYRVPLFVQGMPVELEYAATPKLSPYAYLMADVENDRNSQLLPGEVNIFLDGNFVGSSRIAKAIGSQEKFDLYLGIDEGVTVKRRLLEEKSDDTLIGNIPSPTKSISYEFKLIAENYKSGPVTIHLFDQIPVSRDDKIKVRNVRYSVKPVTEHYKDRQGVVQWTLALSPGEKKEVTLSFRVEHPRDMPVRIE